VDVSDQLHAPSALPPEITPISDLTTWMTNDFVIYRGLAYQNFSSER
jgi:hypothetical protein